MYKGVVLFDEQYTVVNNPFMLAISLGIDRVLSYPLLGPPSLSHQQRSLPNWKNLVCPLAAPATPVLDR